MNDKKQIQEMAREILRVLFEIRQDMTSVIRYIRHEVDKDKELYSNFTLGDFIDRHLKYRQLADETSRNILKNLNENQKLKEIENLCVKISQFGFSENADEKVFYRECDVALNEIKLKDKGALELAQKVDAYLAYYQGESFTTEQVIDIIKQILIEDFNFKELKNER